jgi:hypothetical protein
MPPGGPADPTARAEWVRQRRRAAAAHHPDRGGEVDTYLSALAAVDAAFGLVDEPTGSAGSAGRPRRAGDSTSPAPEVVVRRTWRGSRMRLTRRRRRLMRTVRTRLPRSFPGSGRRTTDI